MQQDDPFKEFGGKALPAKTAPAKTDDDPFAEFGGQEVKKKASTPVVKSTSTPSGTGSASSQTSQASTSKPKAKAPAPQRNANFRFYGEDFPVHAPMQTTQEKANTQAREDEKLTSGLGLNVKTKGLGSSLTSGAGGLKTDFTNKITGKPSAIQTQHEVALNKANKAYQDNQGEEAAIDLRTDAVNRGEETIQTDTENVGNRAGYMYNKFMSGVGTLANGLIEVGLQAGAMNSPLNTAVNDGTIQYYKKEIAPRVRDSFRNMFGTSADLGSQAQYDSETITSAIGGLFQSAPAMMTGHAGLVLQSIDGASQSIEQADPEGKLSNTDKMIYAMGVGLAVGSLENWGLQKIASGNTTILSNMIFSKALNEAQIKAGGKVGGDMLMKYIEANTKGVAQAFAKAGARGVESFLSESLTGGSQEIATIGSEDIFNRLSGGNVFDTEKESSWDGFIKRVAYAGLQEGIGGKVMGFVGSLAGSALNSITRKKLDEENTKIDALNDQLDNPNLSPSATELLTRTKIQTQEKAKALAEEENLVQQALSPEQLRRSAELVEDLKDAEEALKDPSLTEDMRKMVEDQLKAITAELDEVSTPDPVALKQIQEVDTLIKKFQDENPDIVVDPLDDMPVLATTTMDRIEDGLPTDPTALQETSDYLYGKYKELSTMKRDRNRRLTMEQIESMQEVLQNAIETVENYKTQLDEQANKEPGQAQVQPEKPVVTGTVENQKPATPEEVVTVAETVAELPDVELDEGNASGYGTIAADYLLTGGKGTMLSTDYLLQAFSGAFTNAGGALEQIRNKYAKELADNKLTDIKNLAGTEVFDRIVSDIRDALNKAYGNSPEAQRILDEILKHPTGLPTKLGTQISIDLDNLNSGSATITTKETAVEPETPELPDVDLAGDLLADLEGLKVKEEPKPAKEKKTIEKKTTEKKSSLPVAKLADLPQKDTKWLLADSPIIDASEVDLDGSGFDTTGVKIATVRVTEIRGRNAEGKLTGTVRVTGESATGEPFAEKMEVFFNDQEKAKPVTKPAETVTEKPESVTELPEVDLEETNNETLTQTNENESQPEPDTTTVIAQAETTIAEVATVEPESKEVTPAIEAIDEAIADIDNQLRLLGYYNTDGSTAKDDHETGNKAPERKFKKDLEKYSKALATALGFEHDTDKKGKKIYSNTNVAPAGGDGRITLWKPGSEYGVTMSFQANREYRETEDNDNLELGENFMWRVVKRGGKYDGTNMWAKSTANVTEMAGKIKMSVNNYSKNEVPAKITEIAKADPRIMVVKPKPVEAAKPVETPVVNADPEGELKRKKLADAKKAFMASFGTLNSGITPEQIIAGTKLMKAYFDLGVYKFGEIAKDMADEYGSALANVFEGLKSAYGSYASQQATDEEADQMTDTREVRKATLQDFITSDLTEKKDDENVSDTTGSEQDSLADGQSTTTPGESLQDESVEETPDGDSPEGVRPSGKSGKGRKNGGRSAGSRNGRSDSTGTAGKNDTSDTTDQGNEDADSGKPVIEPNSPEANLVITPEMVLIPEGPVQQVTANMNALILLQQVETEDRNATFEEKSILAKFVGWGGLSAYLEGNPNDKLSKAIIAGQEMTIGYYDEVVKVPKLDMTGKTFEQVVKEFQTIYNQAVIGNRDLARAVPYSFQQGLTPNQAREQLIVNMLTETEMEIAKQSSKTAYFTEGAIIRKMWDLAKHFGFKGGKILESSAGVGHFFGMMPPDIAKNSTGIGVEKETVTGRLLRALYPENETFVKGFEEVHLQNSSIDLAIGNVPFDKTGMIYDSRNKDISKFNLHNFFIAKQLRLLKPGGVAILITSASTMDGDASMAARRWFASNEGGNSDLVGAVRLPNNAFGKAGTQVTSDILIFRKRTSTISESESFSTTVNIKTEMREDRNGEPVLAELEINEYFERNPQNMLGEMMFAVDAGSGGLYGDFGGTLKAPDGMDVEAELQKAFESMPKDIFGAKSNTGSEINRIFSGEKAGKIFTDKKGNLYKSEGDEAIPVVLLDKKTQKPDDDIFTLRYKTHMEVAKDYIPFRDAIYPLLEAELDPNATDETIEAARVALNKAYDTFAKKHENLAKHKSWMYELDSEFALASGFEHVKQVSEMGANGKIKKGIVVTKGDMLVKRVNFPNFTPDTAENYTDAMAISYSYKGFIDIAYIAELLKKTPETVEKELLKEELVFKDPYTGLLETPDQYLSGEVRTKLRNALEAAKESPEYARNVAELEKVQPEIIPAGQIDFRVGVGYLPTAIYKDFIEQTFGVTANVNYVAEMGTWDIKAIGGTNDARNISSFGVTGIDKTETGFEILMDAMTNRTTKLYYTVRDFNGKKSLLDEKATEAAADMQERINQEFDRFVKNNEQHRETLETLYNEKFNNYVMPKTSLPMFEYFPGAARNIKLRVHQIKAVVRALTGNTLFAHDVGTGKTFTMITTVMEMRRLGLAKKPMIVVKNSTLNDFAESFRKLYPSAKILVLSKDEISAKTRKMFFGRIPTSDWDCVIVPQSQFNMMPDKPERVMAYLKEKIAEMQSVIDQSDDFRLTGRLTKEVEKLQEDLSNLMLEKEDKDAILKAGKDAEAALGENARPVDKKKAKKEGERLARIKASIKKITDRKTDNLLNFDEMGVDALILDESHSFKKLGFMTNIQNVKGIDVDASQQAVSAYMKVQSVMERTGGRNVVFATGTPITNTMAELWTNMRFMVPQMIKNMGITTFDQFQQTFTDIEESVEQNAGGTFESVKRLSSFFNLQELMKAFRSFADVVTTDDIPEFKADPDNAPPEVKGGGPQTMVLPMTDTLRQMMIATKASYDEFKRMSGKEKRKNNYRPLLLTQIGKIAPIDPRLINTWLPDDPGSKANKAVGEVLRIYKEHTNNKAAQMIFSDSIKGSKSEKIREILGIPEGGPDFNLFDDIKAKLIAGGIPAHEIAIMNDKKYSSDDAKQKLFDAINNGEIRVVMGSTEKMGVGVNAQERLIALHHLDAPARPDQFTQRNGRIIRQGNIFAKFKIPVEVLAYGMSGTRDATAFQRLEKKQNFITQLFKGNIKDRRSDDAAAEESMSMDDYFAEFGALLSGNADAMKLVVVKRELKKEENRAFNHTQRLRDAENGINRENRKQPGIKRQIAKGAEILKYVKANFPDGKITELTINDVPVTEKLGEQLQKQVVEVLQKKNERDISQRGPRSIENSAVSQFIFKVGDTDVTLYVYSAYYHMGKEFKHAIFINSDDLGIGSDYDVSQDSFGPMGTERRQGRRVESANGALQIIRNEFKNAETNPARWDKLLTDNIRNINQYTEQLKEKYDPTKLNELIRQKAVLGRKILANDRFEVKKMDDEFVRKPFYAYDNMDQTEAVGEDGEARYFSTAQEAGLFAQELNDRFKAEADKAETELDETPVEGKSLADKAIDFLESSKIKGGKTMGMIIPVPPAVWNAAMEAMIQAIKAGQNIHKAIVAGSKAIKKDKDGTQEMADEFARLMTEKYAGKYERVNAKPASDQTGIRNASVKEQLESHNLPLIDRTPDTDRSHEALDAEARRLIENGYDFSNLIGRMRRKDRLSDLEVWINKLYLAGLAKRMDADPTQANLDAYATHAELTENAGSEDARSLAARKGTVTKEDNLSNFLIDEKIAHDVAALDPADFQQRVKEYQRDQEVRKEIEEKLKKAQAALAYQKAKNAIDGVKKSSRPQTGSTSGKSRKSATDFQTERISAWENIKKKWAKAARGGTLNSSIPYATQLIEIAPDVAVIVKSYVEEGIVNLDEIVRKLHASLKSEVDDRITESDVLDLIGGEYNAPPQTRSQMAQDISNLKLQAKLLSQIEELEAGNIPVKVSAQKQRNDLIESLKSRVRELEKGLRPDTGEDKAEKSLKARRARLTVKIAQLREDLRTGAYMDEKVRTPKVKPDEETQRLIDEHIAFVKETQLRRQRAQHAARSKWKKAWDLFFEALGVRRLVQAALDWSIPFRQAVGVTMNLRHAKITGEAFANMARSTFSPKFYDRMNFAIHTHEGYNRMLEAGIHFNETSSLDDRKRNEDFKNSFVYKIPGVNIPLLASNRAADSYLNTCRFELFLKMERSLVRQGLTMDNAPEEYKGAAKWVMNVTGRGNMMKFLEDSTAQTILGNTFFGARLMASRFNLLNPVYYAKMPKAVKEEVMLDIANYVGVIGVTALTCISQGATVSFDWDEPEFLQVKFGNRTFDLTGGMGQYLRVYFRLMNGLSNMGQKIVAPNSMSDTAYKKYGGFAVRSGLKFFQYKLSPNTSYMLSGLNGVDAMYKPFDKMELFEIYPMYVEDVREAWTEQGLSGAALVMVPNFFGIGTRNYKDDRNNESIKKIMATPDMKKQIDEMKKQIDNPQMKRQMEEAKRQMEEMKKRYQ